MRCRRCLFVAALLSWPFLALATAEESKPNDPRDLGRIDGTLSVGGKHSRGWEVRLLLPVGKPREPSEGTCNAIRLPTDDLPVAVVRTTFTDEDGRFSFPDVPSGIALVEPRVFPAAHREPKYGEPDYGHHDGTCWLSGLRTKVEVKGGATTHVMIGGLGRPVVGRLVLPDEMGLYVDLGKAHVRMWLQTQAFPADAGQKEELLHPYGAVFKGGSEKAYLRESIPVASDGRFRIEGVPNGTYFLQGILPPDAYRSKDPARPTPRLRLGAHKFTVPPMPSGQGNEAPLVDLGDLGSR